MLPIFEENKTIEDLKLAMDKIAIPLEINHLFTDDQYVREMIVPSGCLVMGMRHKKKTLNILAQGSAILFEENGKRIGEIVAPYTFESEAKVKKLALFLEDSVFLNIHATKTRDFEKLQKELYCEEDIDMNVCQNYDGSIKKEYLLCQVQ